MPHLLTLTEGAKYVGVDRSTLYRNADKGIITTTLNARGKRVVDIAELDRVYGMKQPEKTNGAEPKQEVIPQSDTTQQLATPNNYEIVKLLREQLSDAKVREAQLITERGKLLRMLEMEQQKTQQLMLAPPPEKPKRKFSHIFRWI